MSDDTSIEWMTEKLKEIAEEEDKCFPGNTDDFPHVCALAADEINRLSAEVERLKAREITDEQIDAAWHLLQTYKNSSEFKDSLIWQAISAALSQCGIVECPECDGDGMDSDPSGESEGFDCPRCQGHGWIREERGDE